MTTDETVGNKSLDDDSSNNDDDTHQGATNEPENNKTNTMQRTVNVLPLDWTKQGNTEDNCRVPAIRYPTDVIDISKDDDYDIVAIGTAGQKITNIGPDFYKLVNPNLETLVFRSHLISKMEGLDQLPSLHLLELYDNQITDLNCMKSLGNSLRTLDISFNVIRDMKPVEHCIHLEELYIANNKIKVMAGLSGLTKLRKLDLGANRIRVMDPTELNGLANLEELWLGKNKIEVIQGLESLSKLRRLDIQSNRLLKIDNLIHTELLEEMYFAHNGITDDGLLLSTQGIMQHQFPNLTVLDLSRNQIATTKPFQHLLSLEELWLSGNQITSWEQVEPLKSLGQTLQTIYLEYNPIQSLEPLYRKIIHEMIPSLQQLDAYLIGCTNIPTLPIKSTSTDPVKQIMHNPTISEADKAKQLQDLIIEKAQVETRAAAAAADKK